VGRKVKRTKATFDDISELLESDWVNRIWTFQELVFASNPVLVCGHKHLHWSQFAIGINHLEYSGINYKNGNQIIETMDGWIEACSSRDHVTVDSVINSQLPNLHGSSNSTLQMYKRFMVEVEHRMHRIRIGSMCSTFVLCVVFGLVAFALGLVRSENAVSAKTSKIPASIADAAASATSSAMLCAEACASGSITACSQACSKASDKISSVASSADKLTNQVLKAKIDRVLAATLTTLMVPAIMTMIFNITFGDSSYLLRGLVLKLLAPEVNLVEIICSRKSKDDRDKVFGVQSILQGLSSYPLRPVNPVDTKENIYRRLCVQLMEATSTLQFLLPAATHNFPGYPSWIPNWAADFDPFWMKPTLIGNKGLRATPSSIAHWEVKKDDSDILVVRGRQLCSVVSCFQLHETWGTYDSIQKGIHLKNLQIMLSFWELFNHQEAKIWIKLEKGLGLIKQLDENSFEKWRHFLKKNRTKHPNTILHQLEQESAASAAEVQRGCIVSAGGLDLQDIFQIHITICNILARTKKILFRGTPVLRARPEFERFVLLFVNKYELESNLKASEGVEGFCTHEVRRGDLVMLISGVASPLIARRSGASMRLISPGIVNKAMHGEFGDSSWRPEDLDPIYLI
jgi:hypothetical protein